MHRRRFIQLGSLAALGSASERLAAATKILPTPSQSEGPFYPVAEQKDKDFDLTQIDGVRGVAKGRVIDIRGQVFDTAGQALEDVTVEIWQANAAGRYHHPSDRSATPIDEAFQGWAIVPSGSKGEFRFKTVLPGAYDIGGGRVRPPHIHFKLKKSGFSTLTTQMYFPEQSLNNSDILLTRKSLEEQQRLIAQVDSSVGDGFYFPIVMQA